MLFSSFKTIFNSDLYCLDALYMKLSQISFALITVVIFSHRMNAIEGTHASCVLLFLLFFETLHETEINGYSAKITLPFCCSDSSWVIIRPPAKLTRDTFSWTMQRASLFWSISLHGWREQWFQQKDWGPFSWSLVHMVTIQITTRSNSLKRLSSRRDH